ncbi:ABC-F family ATP-binding cassette domain-containing protein [Anaerobacillus isosaccharinicus]|uniref:ATP-binding cassette domain-containing protein n=1 Tax=Anaerobacillus isosaccharinicus TaxID=1532552 RepID=A0A1S2MDU1_9BACI|nr:ABC-F family ATP-binding cassette domain-containing protein [Anaerobacillus isosaccharinicus]MBA5588797.1 ATP-binding cassette domain-containing protein [Anaerobacillus isosaccharinicus]QOY37808.1 ATP-binding cassette domain-containing protein [Anaerobacillus isosaccharinicus]
MILLQCVQLTKNFGAEPILSNIKLEVQSRDRVAIVGRNGAGKSTLLKIIAGKLSYNSGEVIIPKDVTLGYLAQNTGLESSSSIWDEMLTVFKPLIQMEKELRVLEAKMADPDCINNEKTYEKLLKDYDLLSESFKEQGGYKYEADIRGILSGLNFSDKDYSTKISTLSGGQKTRLALGKLLLTRPDLLILDEPTNHLDLETLTWLEQYLLHYDGAILIVSHDRYFLDKVSTVVYEISRKKATRFSGNYSFYLDEKAKRYELELKQYEKQQGEIEKLHTFVEKNLARASTTKRAQSRRKQLEKMDVLDRPQGDEKSARFSFDIIKQTGNDVLRTEQLSGGYPNSKPLFENLNLAINRSESIALLGPNGIGKSTLLKIITKQLEPLSGKIKYGSNLLLGYYDQEQANLNSNKQVLHELWDEYPLTPEKEIRTILGNFLFSGDDVLKSVSDLSGGEKARVSLAKLMMQKANFLILDEPTNHLDLDSKEILENALIDYPGTILFVSHDRYFVNRMASRVVEMTKDGLVDYIGDYDYYLAKKQENIERKQLKEQQEDKVQVQEEQPNKQTFLLDKEAKRKERQLKRRLEEIEQAIEELELSIDEKEKALCDPEIYQDHNQVSKLNTEIEKQKQELDALLEEWSELEA